MPEHFGPPPESDPSSFNSLPPEEQAKLVSQLDATPDQLREALRLEAENLRRELPGPGSEAELREKLDALDATEETIAGWEAEREEWPISFADYTKQTAEVASNGMVLPEKATKQALAAQSWVKGSYFENVSAVTQPTGRPGFSSPVLDEPVYGAPDVPRPGSEPDAPRSLPDYPPPPPIEPWPDAADGDTVWPGPDVDPDPAPPKPVVADPLPGPDNRVPSWWLEPDPELAADLGQYDSPELPDSGLHTMEEMAATAERERQERENAEREAREKERRERAEREEKHEKQSEERQEKAREKLDRAEMVGKIVEFAKGDTYISTNYNQGFKPNAGDGSGEIRPHIVPNHELRDVSGSHNWATPGWHINPMEMAAFTPIMEYQTEIVSTPKTKKKGLFRSETVYVEQEVVVPGAEKARTITNPDGKEEPAVLFQYIFSNRGDSNPNPGDNRYAYQEFRGGRPGNELVVAIELPASLAEQLREDMSADPQLVRDLVEKLVLENNRIGISEKDWDKGNNLHKHPIRPPYRNLPPGWKMLLAWVDNPNPMHPRFGVDATRGPSTAYDKRKADDEAPVYKSRLLEQVA
jgi:hypothetical protein